MRAVRGVKALMRGSMSHGLPRFARNDEVDYGYHATLEECELGTDPNYSPNSSARLHNSSDCLVYVMPRTVVAA